MLVYFMNNAQSEVTIHAVKCLTQKIIYWWPTHKVFQTNASFCINTNSRICMLYHVDHRFSAQLGIWVFAWVLGTPCIIYGWIIYISQAWRKPVGVKHESEGHNLYTIVTYWSWALCLSEKTSSTLLCMCSSVISIIMSVISMLLHVVNFPFLHFPLTK